MKFLLLQKDLDQRDALQNISDYDIIELLDVPYSAAVASEIWKSPFSIRGSIFITSSVHNLLFNYNHVRHDEESR